MILSKEDFLERLSEIIGDRNDDVAIAFIEDATDTFDSIGENNSEDVEKRIADIEEKWREKYKSRFFSSETSPEQVEEGTKDDVKKDGEEITFDELFEERED